MARSLRFQLGDSEIAFQMQKIDRAKLYGSKIVEALDDQDQLCELATLADDGRSLVGKGSTALGWLDADGLWCSKTDLKPHNVDGDLMKPVASSFDSPIKLFEVAEVDAYLSHNIRLVYRLCWEEAEDSGAKEMLTAELRKGTIFQFPYSFRGGLEADAAFLLENEEGDIMMAVGSHTQAHYVGIASKIEVEDEESQEPEADLMDFDMI